MSFSNVIRVSHKRMGLKHINQRSILALTILASLALYLLYAAYDGFATYFYDDSGSFLIAGDVFLSGEIDYLRTPVYPLLCRLALWISAPHAMHIVSAFQEIVFLTSIAAIFYALIALDIRKSIIYVVTAAYALCPILFLYSRSILSESLAISCTAYLICTLSHVWRGIRPTTMAVASIALFLLMIMLKPFFLCFAPGVAIIIIYSLIKKRNDSRHIAAILVSGFLALAALSSYCYAYYAKYGKFALSCVYELNRDMTLYKCGITDYPQGINYYKYHSPTDINGDSISFSTAWKWQPTKEYLEKCNNIYESNKVRYIINKVIDYHYFLYYTYTYSPTHIATLYYTSRLIRVTVAQINIFLLAFLLIELYLAIKYRKNIVFSFALASFVAATIFTTIWGADEQYDRLMIPMAPCLFVMLALFANRFTINKMRN